MEKQADSKVISRLRKLLALANDARGNENEAEVAMGRAQEIMAEYNLSLAQIGGGEAEDTKRAKAKTASALYQWQRKLMRAIAEVNFCFHEVIQEPYKGPLNRRYTHTHSLIGREANVVASRTMFEYLLETMDRLAPKGEGRTRTEASWKEGCSDRLIERLRERRRDLERASRAKADEERRRAAAAAGGSSGTALAIVLEDVYQTEADLNSDFRHGWEPGTTAEYRRKSRADWEAGRAAREAEVKAAEEKRAAEIAAETPAQKKKREKEEAKEKANRERYWQRYTNRASRPKDWNAYQAGVNTGGQIGLDAQVDKKDGPRAIR